MTEQPQHRDHVEFETPPYGGRFILGMVLLAIATIGLQVILLIWLMPEGFWGDGSTLGAQRRGPMSIIPAMTVMPGSSVICQGQVWVSVATGPPAMPGSSSVRPASSHLIPFDLKTGKAGPSITLSPCPIGLVVIDEQLWGVAETVVYRLQDGEILPRHPRRILIQPSKPFIHEGRLAVIDKNRNNLASLLTWSEGEWVEESPVDLPILAIPNPWFTPELRVLSDGRSTFVFYSDGQTISYREGFNPTSAAEPVSALQPANGSDLTPAAPQGFSSQIRMPGFGMTPLSINWGTSWEVAMINDELWAFSIASPYNRSPIQQFKLQRGTWVNMKSPFPPELQSFGIAGGSAGYLITDDLRLLKLNGSTFEQVTPGTPISERLRTVLNRLGLLGRYLLVNGLLLLGTWWLMRKYRKADYLYGKQTMTQASILRRGAARGIDLLIAVFPAAFWISVASDVETMNQLQQQTSLIGFQNPAIIVQLSIFGMWLGILLVLSFMEGNWCFTPGKYLLGIRTLRTTLRPCGMLRAFARELLIYADSLLFVTWLPGVLMIAFTPNWQRLGDWTADTVVVLDPKRRHSPQDGSRC